MIRAITMTSITIFFLALFGLVKTAITSHHKINVILSHTQTKNSKLGLVLEHLVNEDLIIGNRALSSTDFDDLEGGEDGLSQEPGMLGEEDGGEDEGLGNDEEIDEEVRDFDSRFSDDEEKDRSEEVEREEETGQSDERSEAEGPPDY